MRTIVDNENDTIRGHGIGINYQVQKNVGAHGAYWVGGAFLISDFMDDLFFAPIVKVYCANLSIEK